MVLNLTRFRQVDQGGLLFGLRFTVDVTNTGDRPGKEVVQLYTRDLFASLTPRVKRLRRFEKIPLKPKETKTVSFALGEKDLAFVNQNKEWITEPGKFEAIIEKLVAPFELRDELGSVTITYHLLRSLYDK